MLTRHTKHFYEFGPFRLDPVERLLLCEGRPVEITPKAFDTLLVLVVDAGRLLTKDELLKAVWPNTFVEENYLSVNISKLRAVLGEKAGERQYIETVPRRGYRFVADVREVEDTGPSLLVRKQTRERLVISEIGDGGKQEAPELDLESLQTRGLTGALRGQWRSGRALVAASIAIIIVAGAAAALYQRQRSTRTTLRADAGRTVRSLAVLPFKQLSGADHDQGNYLGVGLADALITRLGQLDEISVRPTSAVLRFDDPRADSLAAARSLGVDAVIEGSYQRESEQLRVTVQLVSARDGSQIWSGTFEDTFTNILAVQDSISRETAKSLIANLDDVERRLLAKHPTENVEAYQLYLKGRYSWNKRTEEGFAKSFEYFEQATRADPTYALAYAGLADAHIGRALYGIAPARQEYIEAKEFALKALELDPNSGEVRASLGHLKFFLDWDFAGAEAEYRRAIELNPNYVLVRITYSQLLQSMGRNEEAFAQIEQARQLDPLDAGIAMNVGDFFYFTRRYDEAVAHYSRTLEQNPDFQPVALKLVRVHTKTGDFAEAEKILRTTGEVVRGRETSLAAWGRLHAAAGRRAQALKVIGELKVQATKRYIPPYTFAEIHGLLGDRDEAFAWLNNALEERTDWLVLLKINPLMDPMRADPRFAELLRRVGLP